ncbi:LPS biosynthesis protein WbpP [Candidatus Poribacteria bacterium]|nr:MAG: LPS biosynthesis protein WbpP [Candidatus Poribacteria bacterium]
MAYYLVTGGCGFVGSHLVEALVQKGERVCVFDNCSTGKAKNIAHLKDQIEFVEGDLRELDVVHQAVAGVDYIFHQGARPSVARSVADPILSNNVNINGTLNLLVAARDAGVKRVVYAASSSAYGNIPTLPRSETLSPQPASPYAITKYVGECYCRVFTQVFGLETVALRYFNIFGPRQDPTSQYSAVIPKFIHAYLHGNSPAIEGDGEQSRDFTYIANAVHANLLACHAEGVAGEVFNIGCGQQTSINKLASLIGEMMETDAQPVYTSSRPGDVRHSRADIRKAQQLLDYEPKVELKAGLRRTIDWFLRPSDN